MTVESAEQGDKLKQSLKEEKQTRKRLESKVDHIEEELNDLKHEKETLERVRTLSFIQIVHDDIYTNYIMITRGVCQWIITSYVFSGSWRSEEETCGR